MTKVVEISSSKVITTDARRQLLILAGMGALTALQPFPALALSLAKKYPTPLDDLITRWTLVIYTGRLKRQVWTTEALSKKLNTEGAVIDPSELKLLGLSDIDIDHASTGFFEIENAKPILKNPSAITIPLHRGTIYCYGYSFREGIVEAERFVGKDVIFLFDGFALRGVGATTFPKPNYARSVDGHWRDGLPIPISELKTVISIGKRAGFVVPSKINSVLL